MDVKLLSGVDPEVKKYKLMGGHKYGAQSGKLFGKLL